MRIAQLLHGHLLRNEHRDTQQVLRIEDIRARVAQASRASLQQVDQFRIAGLLNKRDEVPSFSSVVEIRESDSTRLLVASSQFIGCRSHGTAEYGRDRIDDAIAVDLDIFGTCGQYARHLPAGHDID